MKKRKILSSVLAASMVLSMVPVTALAVDGDDGSQVQEVSIDTAAELAQAIAGQQDGQVWKLAEGAYNLTEADLALYANKDCGGQTGWYFPLTANNLTIIGEGDVTITSDVKSPNANWATQDFVSVWGNDITIDNVDILSKDTQNKAIEVMGQDFTLKNSEMKRVNEWGSGSIIFNSQAEGGDIGTATLENVKLYSWISTNYSKTGTLNTSNVTVDFTDNSYAGYTDPSHPEWGYGWCPGIFNHKSNVTVNNDNLTLLVDDKINLAGQVLNTNTQPNTTVVLKEGTYDGNITIDKSVILKGANAGVGGTSEARGNESVITGKINVVGQDLDVVLDGLKFTEAGCITSANNNAGTDLTVQNCVADGLTNTFVYTSGADDARMGKITVQDNKVTNITGSNLSACNLWNASEHEITGNYVENINFHAFNLDSTIGNVLFENNTIKNTGKGGIQLANYTTGESVIIRGNTFENVANQPYYNDDEAEGLNYAAIRVYSSGENTDKGITANIDITENSFVGNPISIWVTSRKTVDSAVEYFDVNVEAHKNKFEMTENSIYAMYVGVANGVDASENYWGSADPQFGKLVYTVEGAEGNVTTEPYYVAETMRPEDLNTYSSGSTSYAITVDKTDNGTVISSRTRSSKGLTVTLTVKPNEGYKLDTLAVTDKNGSEVKLTDKGDGKYTFTMPGSAVTVKASFTRDDAPVNTGLPFTDVKADDWFYEAVKYVYDNKLMDGTSATTFAPLMTTNRAMIVTILWRLEGQPKTDATLSFTDVESGVWYTDAVNWATSKGIVKGYSDTVFAPNDTVTREQLATILCRYAEYKEYDVTAKGDLTTFADGSTVSAWAADGMTWAAGAQLITGKDGGKLDPTGTATRAEVATILMRFVESVSK
ncbi:MAG: S-layer homology domain-containing protein [Clostridiales bacterium]|uniref:S-layer homology domain-containing protein n=1 Tax=Flavonifractor porci TaxID=3133422 RepID=UPI0030AC5296|nr:S-layer homology domain-containing protein [Clostridiales bacterium]